MVRHGVRLLGEEDVGAAVIGDGQEHGRADEVAPVERDAGALGERRIEPRAKGLDLHPSAP